ncbi:MAG: sialate O-acetylesterase [Muribaculum sp.]|nr:sialate O-acetylesterase [Muribaculum sp.]
MALYGNALTLPAIIGDNMMLQQQTDASLWGWAKPGSEVKVTTDWDGKSYTAKAASNGKWKLTVATPVASYEPTSFSVTGDGKTIKVNNVLIGEVWLASGQSNMEMPLAGFIGSPVDGANDAVATSGRYNKAIRFSTTPRALFTTPQDSVGGDWKECSPENAPEFSAVAYFYARKLNDMLDVPVGIINCSYGGTCVEGWMPESILKDYPDVDLTLAAKEGVTEYKQPMSMYNGMLHPLAPYTIKGFLWNQGESNAMTGTQNVYAEYMNRMIGHWRELWGNDSLPFYIVEIPPFIYDGAEQIMSAKLREAQLKTVDMTPNTGIVSSIDLFTPGLSCQIHPSVKLQAGERLAYMAAGDTYGMKGVRYKSPRFDSMELQDDGATAILRFKDAHDGFTPYQGLKGFEVAGEDHVFHPANATQVFGPFPEVVGISVSSPDVPKIVAVRYAFKNWPEGANVYGVSELPLLPFRTDDWNK